MHCLYGGHCLRVRVRVPAPVDVRVGVCVSNRCVWVPDLSGIRNYSIQERPAAKSKASRTAARLSATHRSNAVSTGY